MEVSECDEKEGGTMRITNNMISDRSLFNIQQSLNRIAKLNDKLSSGKEVQYPSDDAVIEEGFKTDKFFKCWVHLQQEDGSVKVMEVDEFAWRNLYTGDILK